MLVAAYQICSRCVMDTSDPEITFDIEGVCNHCRKHEQLLATRVRPGALGRQQLEAIAKKISKEGASKPYDCIIGVSGGADSTYAAWLAKQLGLRPLAVHLDNGWNSEIAVRNIANALHRLNIDLYTHVIDWEEYKDIQRAFLLASVPDVEIPSDHAILACLYQTARRRGIRAILTGQNTRTESHLPRAWSQGHSDFGYIHAIHKRFGSGRVRSFPYLSFMQYLKHLKSRSRTVPVLEYVDYVKKDAVEIIERELGWRDYGGKHHESIFTRWYQGCYLPLKFGFDKRRTHLSSLVSTGQLSRESALIQLQQPPYDRSLQEQDCDYVAKKLGFTRAELDTIIAAPPAKFEDFRSYRKILESGIVRMLRGLYRGIRRQPSLPVALI